MTPEGVEVPRSLVDEEMQEKLKQMPKQVQPATPKGPDCKWRYMWRVGPRPSQTSFKVFFFVFAFRNLTFRLSMFVLILFLFCFVLLQELNAEPVVPEGFPEWKETMDSWGYKMISAIEVSRIAQ